MLHTCAYNKVNDDLLYRTPTISSSRLTMSDGVEMLMVYMRYLLVRMCRFEA